MRVVGEAASGEQALQRLPGWQPDVLVMDLLMPGGMDGIEAIRRAREIAPRTQIVALTSFTEDSRVIAALRAGAISYVRKDAAPEVLLDAIRAAAAGRSLLDPSVAGVVMQGLGGVPPRGSDLTEREREVLRHVALGRSNREIAEVLVVSAETVKTHVASILDKLGLENRAQVMIYALKSGVVALDEIEL
jgi:NarL family two-component system response regulator LiaR